MHVYAPHLSTLGTNIAAWRALLCVIKLKNGVYIRQGRFGFKDERVLTSEKQQQHQQKQTNKQQQQQQQK